MRAAIKRIPGLYPLLRALVLRAVALKKLGKRQLKLCASFGQRAFYRVAKRIASFGKKVFPWAAAKQIGQRLHSNAKTGELRAERRERRKQEREWKRQERRWMREHRRRWP